MNNNNNSCHNKNNTPVDFGTFECIKVWVKFILVLFYTFSNVDKPLQVLQKYIYCTEILKLNSQLHSLKTGRQINVRLDITDNVYIGYAAEYALGQVLMIYCSFNIAYTLLVKSFRTHPFSSVVEIEAVQVQ